jgi:hypothetical protein
VDSWRLVWREGFAPVLASNLLEALAEALRTDDPRLTQGSVTTPPPLMCVQDWPVEAGCFLAFMGAVECGGFACSATEAVANRLGVPPHSNPKPATVGQAEEFFARCCFEADQRLGEPAACRWLLNWWDDTPRREAFRGLLAEVERVLAERRAA